MGDIVRTNEHTTGRIVPSLRVNGASLPRGVGEILQSKGQSFGEALTSGLWPSTGTAESRDKEARSGYDVHAYGGQWYASRILLNGRRVSGMGDSATAAIEDLEANWRVS